MRIRTGLEIEKDDWKPEPKKAYIIFGGREVVDILIHAQREFDLYYIERWSIWLDIKILFLTFFRGFFDPNAY